MEYNLVDIQNRLILKDDVDVFVNYKDENKLDEKYIHPAGTWSHSDACIKWIASIFILESIEKKDRRYKNGVVPLKIDDLGAGDGPVAHMVADKGHDVVGVDVRSYNFLYQSLAVMVTRDAMEYLKEYEDNSVDVFMDGCAVTHFNTEGDKETPNFGWRNIFESVYRIMKPGGYFICLSDIKIGTETITGEFIIPEDIVRMAEETGLILTSEYNYSRGTGDGLGSDHFEHSCQLGVASFVFTKNGVT